MAGADAGVAEFLQKAVPEALTPSVQMFAFSPLEMVAELIQLGYEPVPEHPDTNFLGRKGFRRLGMIGFTRHIYSTSGIAGLYAGAGARAMSVGLTSFSRQAIKALLQPVVGPPSEPPAKPVAQQGGPEDDGAGAPGTGQAANDGSSLGLFVHKIGFDVTCACFAILVSHPFSVASLRLVAQHADMEPIYKGTLGTLRKIYVDEGLKGLYSGIVPHLLSEVTYIVSMRLLIAVMPDMLDEVHPSLQLKGLAAKYLAKYLFYPFRVTTAVMALEGSSLALAQYPWRPRFPDWASCYTHLYELNGIGDRGLMRGLNNWYRFYSKPIATPTASK